jgi:hypothetical protein
LLTTNNTRSILSERKLHQPLLARASSDAQVRVPISVSNSTPAAPAAAEESSPRRLTLYVG